MLTNFFIILFSTIAYLGSRHLFDFPICVLQWAAAHERKKLCSIVTKFFAPTLQLSVCLAFLAANITGLQAQINPESLIFLDQSSRARHGLPVKFRFG